MKVYEVLAQSMRLAGKDSCARELLAKYRSNATLGTPAEALAASFLIYLNAVLHEISQFYLPAEAPLEPLAEGSDFYYPIEELQAETVEYGIVAENYLVSGEGELAGLWEQKYKNSVRATAARYKRKRRKRPPERRWV